MSSNLDPAVSMGTCRQCGDRALLILGLCGDCAPTTYSQVYHDWYFSPAGQAFIANAAEELLQHLPGPEEPGKTHPDYPG